jgi:dihydrofolate reductase
MTTLSLIAALDRNHAIGRGNTMPWHLPDDLKRFKRLTLGHTVLMGRRTADSIGRALPGRRNLVLTRNGKAPYEGQIAVASVDDAVEHCNGDTLFVIGGGEVYRLTLPQATRLFLTWVDTIVDDADAHFPEFDAREWRITRSQAHPADTHHACGFRFVDYERAAPDAQG